MKAMAKTLSGLYFHIPFCKSKCPYCDFYSVKYTEKASEQYVQRLLEEIKKHSGSFDTVYFGGGTPSILAPELLCKILDAAGSYFEIDRNAEITVECNPSKNLEKDFEIYKSHGINRVSIGMQSARNEERFALGRSAGKTEVAKAISDCKTTGISNISLDIMLGTPGQTLSSLDETFEFIEKMNVTHISAYMLKLEPGTKFFEMRKTLTLPDEDIVAEMYLKTVAQLKKLGFNQYEISNFAKPGFESRHNLKYWHLNDYLGIGASAHSLLSGKRFYYDSNFDLVPDGTGADSNEKIMLGLRMNKGINKKLIKKDYSSYINCGLMTECGSNIALTPEGMLVSNVIIGELLQ